MRNSNLCLVLIALNILLIGLMFTHSHVQRQRDAPMLNRMAAVVENLELTDLCLFTEARYTRHLSQSDLFAAFQDHPLALEHFPAGSLAGPPKALRRFYGWLD